MEGSLHYSGTQCKVGKGEAREAGGGQAKKVCVGLPKRLSQEQRGQICVWKALMDCKRTDWRGTKLKAGQLVRGCLCNSERSQMPELYKVHL